MNKIKIEEGDECIFCKTKLCFWGDAFDCCDECIQLICTEDLYDCEDCNNQYFAEPCNFCVHFPLQRIISQFGGFAVVVTALNR